MITSCAMRSSHTISLSPSLSPTCRLSELNSALLSLKLEAVRDREALQEQQSKVGRHRPVMERA